MYLMTSQRSRLRLYLKKDLDNKTILYLILHARAVLFTKSKNQLNT